ncbi:MAG: hypothetical protein K9K62_10330 [Desulfobacteraceae bacterium]|nr:hypothetical protein [Desulfobacteraceae bacterium]
MEKNRSAAVEKAKRQGAQKNFFITGPTGWGLAEILPRVDMVARLFTDLFFEQKIPREFFDEQKNQLYSYIEGIDDWVSENSELLLRAGLLNNAGNDYVQLYKNGIKKKKTMYLNTQIGLNAYYSFLKCDALSALMTLGLRQDDIKSDEYKRSASKIFGLIEQLKSEITDRREFICECRK